ncbi:hypothetical protein ACFSM5_15380 [Lacibacterium aquatile]|uniref:Uncharacterized protein n=1 Tax=Lacibacterium aquatile TaxID=1168082 RepID=A0ABW5DWV7_9PROT
MAVTGGLIDLSDYDPGVYLLGADGSPALVHLYEEGDYKLSDVVEFYELGELLEEDGAPGLELDEKEILQLAKAVAKFGEDHPPEFNAMCTAIVESVEGNEDAPYSFYSNF